MYNIKTYLSSDFTGITSIFILPFWCAFLDSFDFLVLFSCHFSLIQYSPETKDLWEGWTKFSSDSRDLRVIWTTLNMHAQRTDLYRCGRSCTLDGLSSIIKHVPHFAPGSASHQHSTTGKTATLDHTSGQLQHRVQV